MPLIVFHTRKVREALKAPAAWSIDFLLLGAVAAIIGAFFMFTRQIVAPYEQGIEISLSFWALPKYTFFSLSRGFAAYVLSLGFTLVYGTIAAHNHRAERIMIPALDVLQAIPVLGFLPGLVLAMVSLFPTRELGLELACIIMIFTGQVWNMTFSFHGSLRAIPAPLREVARIQGLSWWQTFRLLEVPAAMIGLVWNSMMSMAGGWFFLTVTEAFKLGNHDYRLPGIGSYMIEAIDQNNLPAMFAAIVAMVLMIVVVDQVFWRPIVVWSQKYKIEETADADKPQSWVLALLQKSRVYHLAARLLTHPHQAPPAKAIRTDSINDAPPRQVQTTHHSGLHAKFSRPLISVAKWIVLAAIASAVAWGTWALCRLLLGLPLRDAHTHQDWLHVLLALGASFLRTSAAVILGA
ncbi:MAG TPA: ABC transporter permease subunit, partial [Tepidisphaeraceae bacterium]|nr:ABC transporter permease subunit [Tepidisphaeraceae bacterium]